MDLSLSPDQELIRNTAKEFVSQEFPKDTILDLDLTESGFNKDLWNSVSEIGWLGILIPEQYGGSENSLTDAAVLFEELGKAPVPGPFFSSGILSANIILKVANDKQKKEILPNIASGEYIVAVAITEPSYGWDKKHINLSLDNSSLSGTKLFVQDGLSATHLLCVVRSQQNKDIISIVIVDVNSQGVSRKQLPGFLSSSSEITFESVQITDEMILGDINTDQWDNLYSGILNSLPILCSYQVGGSQAVFDLSVEYSRTRKQFGQSIGRFQRVQDHIITVVNQLDAARWTTYEALWKLESNMYANTSVHLASAVSSEAYLKACDGGHEVHAGIGSLREYGLTLHTKMSRTLYHFLGDPRFHKRKIAESLNF
jgi:alkylation response protein AidB-like acyl-CoA dehydrogenase